MVELKIINQNIKIIHYSDLDNVSSCLISNSVIDTINFDLFDANIEIIIENCIINNLLIHECWFRKGLLFKNNNVLNYIDYQMGGHNKKPIKFIGNVFNEFVNFFDCQFDSFIELDNNIFTKGTNLLGNKDEGFKNTFTNEIILLNNIGNLYIDGLGR